MKKVNSAVISAISIGTLAISGATVVRAADLGDSCCADLESRVAELESTTARKGNRNVSLTISGYVAQEVTWWDDGGESNIYLHGLGPTQATHVKFTGEAQFAPGWTAGYTLRIQNLAYFPQGKSHALRAMDKVQILQGLLGIYTIIVGLPQR